MFFCFKYIKSLVIYFVTKYVTYIVTQSVNVNDTYMVTKICAEFVTVGETKNITTIKSIALGKKDVVVKFTSDKKQRPNYNLSENTIEKQKEYIIFYKIKGLNLFALYLKLH